MRDLVFSSFEVVSPSPQRPYFCLCDFPVENKGVWILLKHSQKGFMTVVFFL